MEATFNEGGVEVTLRRRTNLSEAKKNSMINKMGLFYIELADELKEDADAINIALSTYARLSAQVVGQAKGIVLAEPSDSAEVLILKSRLWLLETNPDISVKLAKMLDQVNATWNEPAMAPILPEGTDPN